MLFFLYNLLIGFAANGGSIHGWIGQFAHVWGMSHKKITGSFVYHLDQNFDPERKDRSDKGWTVFNRKISKIVS